MMARTSAIVEFVWIVAALRIAFGEDDADGLVADGLDSDTYGDDQEETAVSSFLDEDEDGNDLTTDILAKLHGHMDGDRNGNLSYKEILSYVDAINPKIESKEVQVILSEMDTSNDGMVSLGELSDHVEKEHNEHSDGADGSEKDLHEELDDARTKFVAADADQNHQLDEHELKGLYFPDMTPDGVPTVNLQQAFLRKDTNTDGKLTPREFWEYLGEDEALTDQEASDFKRLDSDADGFLSIDEFRIWEMGHYHAHEAMEELFQIADKNKDKYLTKEEISNAREDIAVSAAQYHLLQYAEHHSEL